MFISYLSSKWCIFCILKRTRKNVWGRLYERLNYFLTTHCVVNFNYFLIQLAPVVLFALGGRAFAVSFRVFNSRGKPYCNLYVCDVVLRVYSHRASWKVCLTAVGIEPATFGLLFTRTNMANKLFFETFSYILHKSVPPPLKQCWWTLQSLWQLLRYLYQQHCDEGAGNTVNIRINIWLP
jgi:hypothetical protein